MDERSLHQNDLALAQDGLPVGWFDPLEGKYYADLVRRLSVGSRAVEVGTWLGRSLAFMLPAAIQAGSGVWCVDTWLGSPNDETGAIVQEGFDAFDVFRKNMTHLGLWGTFTVLHADQHVVAQRFEDASLSLVFLDADHSYTSVLADVQLWWPKLKAGGFILGHDYSPRYPGVRQAVDQVFGRPDELVRSVWKITRTAHRMQPY